MLEDLRLKGPQAHSDYGTWILDDAGSEPMVRHAHGRAFLTDALRDKRIQECLQEKKGDQNSDRERRENYNYENENDEELDLKDVRVYEAVVNSEESDV